MDQPLTIVVIEDDADTRSNLNDILALDDYHVEAVSSAEEAFRRRDWSGVFAVLLDWNLPDGSADQVLPRLKVVAPEAAVLVVTGYADLNSAITAVRAGAEDYILKPVRADTLRTSLSRLREHKRLADAKRRSEAAFRNLVQAAGSMIVILRADATIVYFNPFAEELTGYSSAEVLGRDYPSIFLPPQVRDDVLRDMRNVFAGTPTRGYENSILCRDGSQRWLVWNATRLDEFEGQPAVLAIGQDITERKAAEERAVQAERLAAIGQMVAGLAHESRNAFQRSQACLEMLALEIEDRPEAVDLVHRIQKALDHLHHLYEEVRGYAAPIQLRRESCDLVKLWRDTWANLELMRRDKSIELREVPPAQRLTCEADAHAIEQVFRNVLENAIAACRNPGEIIVRTGTTRLNRQPAVWVSFHDNGPGFTPATRARVFEPFFTTKVKGTGLGMAIAQRIVEAHGGRIAVGESSPGAEIVVTLPRGNAGL